MDLVKVSCAVRGVCIHGTFDRQLTNWVCGSPLPEVPVVRPAMHKLVAQLDPSLAEFVFQSQKVQSRLQFPALFECGHFNARDHATRSNLR